MVADDSPEHSEDRARQAVHGLGLLALVIGLIALHGTALGSNPLAALAGMSGQLAVTVPAALLVTLAVGLNLAAGAVLMRLLVGAPPSGLRQAILAGLAGAVILDTGLMVGLGSIGAFSWPLLVAAQLGVLVIGLLARPWLRRPLLHRPLRDPSRASELRAMVGRWPLAAALITLVWSGSIVLTLASPVVPFLDVLPNQVAPVEHLRAFGTLERLDTTPSPIYGPSRIFLGYQALLGTIATVTGVSAALTVAAFAVPLLLLVATGAHGLAGTIAGQTASGWALVLVPLSATFLRLPDARAGVLAFPLVALLLWLVIDPPATSPRRRAAVLALVLSATIIVHPLIGLLAAATLGIVALLRPERYGEAITVVVVAFVATAPQWALTAGFALPAAAVALAPVLAGAMLVVLVGLGRVIGALAQALRRFAFAALVGAAGLAVAAWLLGLGVDSTILGRDWLGEYPVLLAGAALGFALGWRLVGADVLAAGLGATLLAGAVAALLPGADPLVAAARFEVPKTLAYFAPPLMAVAAAVGVAELWRRAWPLPARAAPAAMLIVFAAAPLRPSMVEDLSLGEHRLAESLSISWRNAAHGYWQGFPDSRTLTDTAGAELVVALRAEIRAGRLRANDEVLHVARSFQPWAATPLAVFAGVIETMATTDPERSIHTHGGRLHDLAELPALLDRRPPYVVLEPAGLAGEVRAQVAGAGYDPIFANARGEVFVRMRP